MWQPVTIYQTVQEPTAQTTIADVLIGAGTVVLGLMAVAMALGLACAWALIAFGRSRRQGRAASGNNDATRLGLDPQSSSSVHPEL